MRKEIPILFSTEMVQAILSGRKTQTRRLFKMKKQIEEPLQIGYTSFTHDRHISVRGKHASGEYGESMVKCPYGKVGDVLWVRENLRQVGEIGLDYVAGPTAVDEGVIPESYGPYGGSYSFRVIPAIHMPKWAARIWLEVVSVRVERLQVISDADAIAEGIESYTILGELTAYQNYSQERRKDFLSGSSYSFNFGKETQSAPVASYCTLWIDINGRDSWIDNPWVWVVEFKVLSTTGKPSLPC